MTKQTHRWFPLCYRDVWDILWKTQKLRPSEGRAKETSQWNKRNNWWSKSCVRQYPRKRAPGRNKNPDLSPPKHTAWWKQDRAAASQLSKETNSYWEVLDQRFPNFFSAHAVIPEDVTKEFTNVSCGAVNEPSVTDAVTNLNNLRGHVEAENQKADGFILNLTSRFQLLEQL